MKFPETWLGSARNQSIGKKAAAARSTRLRPIHFSNRGNSRGLFSFRSQSLQNCNVWQDKFFQAAAQPYEIVSLHCAFVICAATDRQRAAVTSISAEAEISA